MYVAGLAKALASYFGDDDSVPGGLCGKCTFCTTGSGVSFALSPATSATATDVDAVVPADPCRIQAILQACPERDDPRLLARMAFGITSPRLTAGRWSTSHPLFGSMVDVGFNALVKAFGEECEKAGYTRDAQVIQIQPSMTSKKRSYNQSDIGSSYGQSSKGKSNWGGSKRGRYRR